VWPTGFRHAGDLTPDRNVRRQTLRKGGFAIFMVLEVAILDIKPGQEIGFEHDFSVASACISSINGYFSHELHRCMEKPNRYVLMVRWETLEAHTEGFRKSSQYLEWKNLLHHYYDPFPIVEHYTPVFG
jgi:heme-degrading monooxygenase HmoA